MALQFRRGTDSERQQIEFAAGEPVYVTDTGELFIGDGETEGGRPVLSNLVAESNPQLGDTLDLNNNNITGTGNIAIDGNIGGPSPGTSLSLGTSLDLNNNNIIGQGNIIIDGYINASGSINLGDSSEDDITVGGQINSPLVPAENGSYDLGTSELRWRNGFFQDSIFVNIIEGNLLGSLYSEDSSILVDANDNSLHTDSIEIRSNSLLLTDGFELIFDKTKSALAVWEEVDSEVTNAPRFSTRASRTSGGSITSVTSNDVVAANIGTMFDGQDFVLASAIATTVDQQTGTNTLPTRLDVFLAGADNQQTSAFRVNSRGTASANVFKTGSYEDEDERDSLIPSPEPGMIILLTGHNDSTGVPKFQGYDGTQWIDFT